MLFDADVNALVSIFIISNLAKFFPKESICHRLTAVNQRALKEKKKRMYTFEKQRKQFGKDCQVNGEESNCN